MQLLTQFFWANFPFNEVTWVLSCSILFLLFITVSDITTTFSVSVWFWLWLMWVFLLQHYGGPAHTLICLWGFPMRQTVKLFVCGVTLCRVKEISTIIDGGRAVSSLKVSAWGRLASLRSFRQLSYSFFKARYNSWCDVSFTTDLLTKMHKEWRTHSLRQHHVQTLWQKPWFVQVFVWNSR